MKAATNGHSTRDEAAPLWALALVGIRTALAGLERLGSPATDEEREQLEDMAEDGWDADAATFLRVALQRSEDALVGSVFLDADTDEQIEDAVARVEAMLSE